MGLSEKYGSSRGDIGGGSNSRDRHDGGEGVPKVWKIFTMFQKAAESFRRLQKV